MTPGGDCREHVLGGRVLTRVGMYWPGWTRTVPGGHVLAARWVSCRSQTGRDRAYFESEWNGTMMTGARTGWTLICTVALVSASGPSARARSHHHASQVFAWNTIAWNAIAWNSSAHAMADVPNTHVVPPPPMGQSAFRPAHFSLALIAVVVQESRMIACSRIGGITGP